MLRYLVFSLLALASATLNAEEKPPVYLILGAVPQEIEPITFALQGMRQGELEGLTYYRGTIAGKDVIVSLTGVGKTYTGMVTALFLREFQPEAAFMTGTGARINPKLRTGDVIVPHHVFMHDYGSLNDDGIHIAGFQSPSVANGEPLLPNDFEVSLPMRERAMALVERYDRHSVEVDGTRYQVTVRDGVVASGDFFGVPQGQIDHLRALEVDIMEMESASFALVCGQMGVPFLVVRSGSNQAQPQPSDDYLKYGPIAAASAAQVTLYLVSNW